MADPTESPGKSTQGNKLSQWGPARIAIRVKVFGSVSTSALLSSRAAILKCRLDPYRIKSPVRVGHWFSTSPGAKGPVKPSNGGEFVPLGVPLFRWVTCVVLLTAIAKDSLGWLSG
jgi:hypothetical protein